MTYAPAGRRILDADSHIMEREGWLASYATAEVAAALEPLDLGDGDYAAMAEVEASQEGRTDRVADEDLMRVKAWDAIGAYDRDERSRALDLLGFEMQLVFPTFAMTQMRTSDPDVLYGGAAALTRAMVDFCSEDPRLLAVGYVPLEDPARAAEATRDAVEAGCRAMLVPSSPPAGHGPSHVDLMPVWHTLADAGVPFVLHIDGTEPIIDPVFHRTGRDAAVSSFGGGEHLKAKDYMGIGMQPELFLSAMILDGVFDEIPSLRGGSVEQGAMWVVPWMKRLDLAQDGFKKADPNLARLSMRASEYVRRQVRVTPFPTEPVGWLIEQAGDELFMFSTDYPHVEGGRDPLGRFERSLVDIGDAAEHRFYFQNFADLVGG